jgi:hypothetical protein
VLIIEQMTKELFGFHVVNLSLQMLTRRTKYELISNLITQMEINLRDESIKYN